MKKHISLFLVIIFTIACAPQVKISNQLKEAWNIVNREQDIYQRHLILSEEIAKIDAQILSGSSQNEVMQLTAERQKLENELSQEEQKIIQVQQTVETASDKQIIYLASL